ncbi:MAG TPA: transglycosylase SLT domain-containing protein, partial [Nitrospiraceae bacterium]|nr:transglycosylase SLT domain-containing protein [Nitrospiraceae bacterium]
TPLMTRSFGIAVPVITCLVAALTVIHPAHADIYQYTDANGTITLTNVPNDPRYHRILTEVPRPRMFISKRELEPVIVRHSRRHRLHPALIRAVIKAESDFDPMAISRAGAVGLMQLMPQTAAQMDVQDVYNPDQNIAGGTRYLRQLLDRFDGNLPLALAAYNAGETTVERYQSLPPFEETRRYVKKVLRYYRDFLFNERIASLAPARPHAVGTRSRLLAPSVASR